jgi:hypothetical protein
MAISANPVLFADDASMSITKSDTLEFTNTIHRNITKINRWFKSNALSLNIYKTHVLQFYTKINPNHKFQIPYENKLQRLKAKFLGLTIDQIYHGNNTSMIQYPNLIRHALQLD